MTLGHCTPCLACGPSCRMGNGTARLALPSQTCAVRYEQRGPRTLRRFAPVPCPCRQSATVHRSNFMSTGRICGRPCSGENGRIDEAVRFERKGNMYPNCARSICSSARCHAAPRFCAMTGHASQCEEAAQISSPHPRLPCAGRTVLLWALASITDGTGTVCSRGCPRGAWGVSGWRPPSSRPVFRWAPRQECALCTPVVGSQHSRF